MLGRKWYGKFGVALFGRDHWDKQEPQDAWTDGGAVRDVLAEAQKAIERIVSENAVFAVSDFASTGTAALRGDEAGEVILGVRIESGRAHQIIEVPLKALFTAALKDMRATLGVDPQAQAALSALISLGQQLASLRPTAQAAPQAQLEAIARPKPGRPAPTLQGKAPAFPGPVMG